MNDPIDELTLLLLYLTSFKDDYGLGEFRRSWKGYPFESLDQLTDDRYIFGSKRSKSVYLTDEGIKKARELMEKYNVEGD
ncbi:hypothetical protein SAMN05216238_11287 [Lentibacillus persicus]|uniref:DUF6429 domain-containing protein n=1 Tax=Lentibacillus persicus TaxID=640948 RepID=A0A1I1ZGB0_9BACI|nr:DUF6429 family protein [Lentibacillus persicus]SFE30761.1 hypothetical protein SAMN05216238_11287 [Lentibacillus persicus]